MVDGAQARCLPGISHGVELFPGGGNGHAHLIAPVFADQGDVVVVDGITLGKDEGLVVVHGAVGLDGVLHLLPVGGGVESHFVVIDGLQSALVIVGNGLGHVVVHDDVGGGAGGDHLHVVGDFVGTGDGHKLHIHVVLFTEFLLHPLGVVVVGHVPVFEAAVIDRDLQGDPLGETGRIIGVGTGGFTGGAAVGAGASACGGGVARTAAAGQQGGGHCGGHQQSGCLFPCVLHCFPPYT